MATYNGHLNANEIFTSIFNMIIGQEVFSDNVGGMFSSLVDRARIDGTMLGDTYLKYSTDALATEEFDPTGLLNSGRQANVLEQHRPKDPYVQAITIDTFRQIPVTIDHYFTKRAFSTESAFADFNSVTLQWLRDTKRIYDATTYNVFVGTDTPARTTTQIINIAPSAATGTDAAAVEGRRRINAQNVARKIADILVSMRDVSTDFNDLGYYRAWNLSDLMVVWNADWVNELRKVDLPTIFNKDGLFEIKEENILPAKYFGFTAASSLAPAAWTTTRALYELVDTDDAHHWPGEIVNTAKLASADAAGYYNQTGAVDTASLTPDGSIVCKIMHKRSIPYMSGFETETEFINPRLLNENHYLTFGHNSLQHLVNYPLVTVTYNVT